MIPYQLKERIEYLEYVFNYYDYPEVANVISVIKQGLEAGLLDNEIKQAIIAPKKDIPTVEDCDT